MDSNQYAIELVTYLLVLVVYFYELIVYMLLERNAFHSIAYFSQCTFNFTEQRFYFLIQHPYEILSSEKQKSVKCDEKRPIMERKVLYWRFLCWIFKSDQRNRFLMLFS